MRGGLIMAGPADTSQEEAEPSRDVPGGQEDGTPGPEGPGRPGGPPWRPGCRSAFSVSSNCSFQSAGLPVRQEIRVYSFPACSLYHVPKPRKVTYADATSVLGSAFHCCLSHGN